MSASRFDRIQCVPLVHGRLAFAIEVRRRLLAESFAALAVELPPSLRRGVELAITRLPVPQAIFYGHRPPFLEPDAARYYVPIQPGDGIVEALRVAATERVPVHFIDAEIDDYHGVGALVPDPHALHGLGLDDYLGACQPVLEAHRLRPADPQREAVMARALKTLLDAVDGEILFVCGMAHWARIRDRLERADFSGAPAQDSPADESSVRVLPLHSSSWPHVMGEMPYVVGQYELHRGGFQLEDFEPVEALKRLLIAARDLLARDDSDSLERPEPQRLRTLLDFLRKLTLRHGALLPTTYDLVVAAKGCVGNDYALYTLAVANSYPFGPREPEELSESPWDDVTARVKSPEARDSLWCGGGDADLRRMRFDGAEPTDEPEQDPVRMTVDRVRLEGQDLAALARLPGTPFSYGRLNLERRPDRDRRREYETRWDESVQCSWPPEDVVIENFRDYVGKRALSLARVGQSRTEPFVTSFLDGLDIRATLRDVVDRRLHVREEPRLPGAVGALVIIFEEDDFGERYPWRTTWLAEHDDESTLCFYATEWRDNIIGPGIARAHYGGCLMIFPPRHIPDMWNDLRFEAARTPSERLLLAGIYWSPDHYIVHVGKRPPRPEACREANDRGKHILHLPLSTFSRQTLERIRRVHVLNGRHVRSYAHRFIR